MPTARTPDSMVMASAGQTASQSLQAMQRELPTAPAIDHARVQAVREALQAGTYKINAEAIADGMLGLEGQLGG